MSLVAREHILVEQQLHLAHGVLYDGGFQLAFPDDDDVPPVLLQHTVVLLVAFLVAMYLRHPELAVRRRNLATGTVNYQL